MNEQDPTLRALDALEASLADLRAVVADAASAQWEKAPVPSAADTDGRRTSVEVPNPTLSIALDPKRLALRARVLEAERAIVHIDTVVRYLRRRTEEAVERWHGGDQ